MMPPPPKPSTLKARVGSTLGFFLVRLWASLSFWNVEFRVVLILRFGSFSRCWLVTDSSSKYKDTLYGLLVSVTNSSRAWMLEMSLETELFL